MNDVPQAVEYRVAKSSNVLFSIVVLVIMAFLIGLTAWEGRRDRAEMRRATECIIEQFAEHREANRAAHQAFAQKLDAPYGLEAGELLPPVLDRLEEACAPFVKD